MRAFNRLAALFACFLLVALPVLPANARGPGNYAVQGTNPGGKGGYSGTATLVQTGENTWRLSWRIGNQSWDGWGIGDGQVIAVNYRYGSTTGVILMIAKEDGGYRSVWANSGSTDVGTEEWSKR
jgi:hypothetical protein